MIQRKNCQSLRKFGVRHQSQIWPQRVGVLWADFVPHAVKRNQRFLFVLHGPSRTVVLSQSTFVFFSGQLSVLNHTLTFVPPVNPYT